MMLLDVLFQFAAELPDPGAPMFPGICASYGGFVGGLVGWRGQHPIGPHMAGGTIVGFAVGFLCWLMAIAMDRL